MSWAQLIQLIIQFGPSAFDLADKLITKWGSQDPVTEADIQELRDLGKRSGRDALVEALVRAGVPLDSEQAQNLLQLVK